MKEFWRDTFQTTIDAYYAGDLDSGRAACERLLALEELPPEIAVQTRRNLVFYTLTLKDLVPAAATWPVRFPVPDGWSLLNPSIAANPAGDGFTMIARSANYTVTPDLRYSAQDSDGIFRTTNYLVALAPDLDIQTVAAIEDGEFRPEPPPFPVSGFEDPRLFHHRDSWWFTATVRDRNPGGICQIALVRLEGADPVELHLLSDGVERHEKNWMPVVHGSGEPLRFVYSCFPTVVLRYDDETAHVTAEVTHDAAPVARRFSGGSQLIPFQGGRLGLVHEGVNYDDGRRVYLHRWIWFDDDWRLVRMSTPFSLQQRGIEFAAGLARRGDDLLISYGLWDREAWLATVPAAAVGSLLAPPLDAGEIEQEMRGAMMKPVPVALPAPAQPMPAAVAAEAAGFTPFPEERVTIASTTLTGNSEAIIADALRSVVDWVDWCVLIDTGISDDTVEIARGIAGEKLVVRPFPWQNDFAAARNFALDVAVEIGAGWAMTLDTDERIDPGSVDVRAALAATAADALHIAHAGGTYGKERFFRLPARGRYVGPTHEAFLRESGDTRTLEGMHFAELSKSPAEYRAKAERDIAILTRHTAEHPDDPRWFYYLGDSYAGLGMNEEAVAAFRVCASLNGWDEEGAWAMYRAAECLLRMERPVEAIEACAVGMAKHPGLGELPWLAGFAAWQAGRPAQAAHWARISIILGQFMGSGSQVARVGFRHPPALWEGPFDVLRYALRAQGDETGADEAERIFAEAQAAREKAGL